MRFPITYVALAISAVASLSGAAAASSCWTTSRGVTANWGSLPALRQDANQFCGLYSSNVTAISSGSGILIPGYQSTSFIGYFANWTSCMTTFNTLVTDCYGTPSTSIPATLGGNIVDPAGAKLTISFGDGIRV